MRKAFALFLVLVLLISAVPVAAKGPVQTDSAGTRSYIVRMVDSPVVAYRGGVSGYKATAPRNGQKIDPLSSDVVKYAGYLDNKHDQALAKVGGGKKLYDYRYSFNGFAADLTPAQATKLASVEGVLAVTQEEVYTVDTATTPQFLGLTDPGGLWEQLGGIGRGGEDIIIGVIDTGIWPENPAFSDRTGENGNGSKDGKLDYQQIPGWHGKCEPGQEFTAANCNQKLIGAQYFNEGQGGDAGVAANLPWEFNSPRDYNGHGSHTASTAGGNYGVQVTGPAAALGTMSGIAPRARIAAYKALWHQADGTGSGSNLDLVAAIDQAVADGVDVINYSISGTRTNFRDPVEIAFMYAADAGIFVATSAGNSGPTVSTVAHPSPWVTTVAAGTHNRDGVGSVTLGNGVTYNGASMAPTVVTGPFIDSTAAGLPGADPTQVALCYSSADGGNVLDPAKVAGKIVLCDRGVTARVNKSLAVQEAGGIGMVLVNPTANSINADFHYVPSVHVNNDARAALKAYAATAGATAMINKATVVTTAPAPFTASFSSRGPLIAGNGDLLKPDVIAPGQDILAAVAPPGNAGQNFNLYSGTSMSSPHVAGLAALLMDLHPEWSPMMIKSALMTTAYDILDGPNSNPLVIFRQGAGHVKPNSAADPGLVFDSGYGDWLGFLCGTQLPTSFCTSAGVPVLDPSDFNTPAIAIGDLAGSQTVTRTLTNVGGKETYTASVSGMVGIDVTVSPASFTLNPGESQTVTVSFTRTNAALNAFTGGQLTWTGDKGHRVRIPLVIRPVALAAPVQVSGSYKVVFGYTGPFTATARGLIPAAVTEGTVADDPTDTFVVNGPGTVAIPVTVPAGTTYARFSLFDGDVTAGADLDLYVTNAGGATIGSSGNGASDEEINFVNMPAGTYTVWVHGWGVPSGESAFKLHTWLLGTAGTGNMTVTAPANAVLAGSGDITLSFSGLAAGTRYLGSVAYGGATGMPNPTIVRVDVP